VLQLQGPGKKKALSDLFKSKNLIRINKLPVDFAEVFIGAVDSYKHLGTQIRFKGMAYEVSFRCGLMRAETSKLRRILRNSELNSYKNSFNSSVSSVRGHFPMLHLGHAFCCVL